jgi:hypothetical protein
MVHKDPERRKEYLREYARKNKERIAEYKKTYREEHKDKIAEYDKERYENNKQYYIDYKQTPQGIKTRVLNHWKSYGVICNDFDKLYDLYINTDKCMYCEKVFADSFDRCLDHDHKTGLYRAVLCRVCNIKDVLN